MPPDGINAEVFQRMGMATVNMPGGEIIPAAQRGVIDCAEWVGGIEDLRLGLHQVYKYHYTPGLHENNTIGELTFNLDVWKSFTPMQQEQVRSALRDALHQLAGAQPEGERRRAEGVPREARRAGAAHAAGDPDRLPQGVGRLGGGGGRAQPVLQEGIGIAAPVGCDRRAAKRFMQPPYSFAANYYWPEKAAAKPAANKK